MAKMTGIKDAGKYIQAGAKGAVRVGAGIIAQKAGGELLRGFGGVTVANFEGQQPDLIPPLVNVAGGTALVLGGAAVYSAVSKKRPSVGSLGLIMVGVVVGAAMQSQKVSELMDRAAGAITGLVPGGLSSGVAMSFAPGAANLGSYGAPAMLIPGGMSAEVANVYPAGAKYL